MSTAFEMEMEGELEGEFENELEGELEGEYEGEEFLGTIARGIGSLLGESEYESEFELEGEFEGEYEGEEFFRRIARGVGSFVRRAAPVLRRVARVAAPIVGTAVGGPLGGVIGRVASSALGEGEFEEEMEGEFEGEYEEEMEGESEGEYEAMAQPAPQAAVAEYMASAASRVQNEAEAEAMIGACAVTTISPADRAALRRILPHLVRGAAILTRILRRQRITRPAVRAIPAIVRRTARTLANRAAAGQPVTRRTAGRVMAAQTRRVLSSPRTVAPAIVRNIRAARRATQPARRPVAGRPMRRPGIR